MIKYRLTCIKDMPEVDAGFQMVVSEYKLTENGSYQFYENGKDISRKVYALIRNHNNPKFVKKEIAEDYAIEDFVCPVCKTRTLFPYVHDVGWEHESDVGDFFYVGTGIECAKCRKHWVFQQLCTKSRIDW